MYSISTVSSVELKVSMGKVQYSSVIVSESPFIILHSVYELAVTALLRALFLAEVFYSICSLMICTMTVLLFTFTGSVGFSTQLCGMPSYAFW